MAINDIEKYLHEKEADFSCVSEETIGDLHLVKVEVEWGDWKHSHSYLDSIMEQKGYILLNENVTEDDGSDCYSSIHIFHSKDDTEKVNAYRQIFSE